MTHFKVHDAEALAILIRLVDHRGESVERIVPINDQFVVSVTGDVKVDNFTDLEPFKAGVCKDRTYCHEIVTVTDSALEFVGIPVR